MKAMFMFIVVVVSVCSLTAQDNGSFTDDRDGQSYKTNRIGTQNWMAENLNYATNEGSWCYENNSRNCDGEGRIYNWQTALSVCPLGWRLPTSVMSIMN